MTLYEDIQHLRRLADPMGLDAYAKEIEDIVTLRVNEALEIIGLENDISRSLERAKAEIADVRQEALAVGEFVVHLLAAEADRMMGGAG